jgi:hypothetical protein
MGSGGVGGYFGARLAKGGVPAPANRSVYDVLALYENGRPDNPLKGCQ